MVENVDNHQPDNVSLLAPNAYKLVFTKIPNLVYNAQRVDLPGLTLGTAQVFTGPFTFEDVTVPGEKITYDPLSVGIIMDEDMKSWEEIYNWMFECAASKGKGLTIGERLKAMGDCSVIVQTNKFNPSMKYNFYDIFPVTLGVVPFDYTSDPSTPIIYDVTFNFRRYTFERL